MLSVVKRAGVAVVAILLLVALVFHLIDASVYQSGTLVELARYGSLALLVPVVALSGGLAARERRTWWPWLLLASLVLLALLSVAWSIHPDRTLRHALLFAVVIVVVAVLGNLRWPNRERLTIDLWVVVAVFGAAAVVGLVAWLVGAEWAGMASNSRVSGIYVHPNGSGMVAALVLPVGVALVPRIPSLPGRSLHLGLLAALAASLVLSGSRTSLVALVVAGVVMVLMRGWLRNWRIAVPIGLCVGIVVLVVVSGQLGSMWERSTDQLFTGREGAWATLVDAWEDAPVAGHGYRSAELILEERRGDPHEYFIGTAHNGYLQVLAELGAAGALLVVGVIGAAARAGWRSRRDPIGVGLAGSVAAGFTIQFGESSLFGFGNEFALPFWLLVGALLSMSSGPVVDRAPRPSQL
ncbi:MAG: O-antigen ligase family protein [Acidimicrobiales bacterium]|nr:O-antigen ligase family protein [Acidimicrobiales bacterium]